MEEGFLGLKWCNLDVLQSTEQTLSFARYLASEDWVTQSSLQVKNIQEARLLFLVCMAVPLMCWRARFIVTHQTGLSNHRVSHAYWLHKKVICGMNGKITQILIYSFYLCPQIDVLYTRERIYRASLWIISFLWKSKWKCNFTAKTNEPNWEPIPVKWTEHWRCFFQEPYAWVGMIKHI